jgi:hypothetical protein
VIDRYLKTGSRSLMFLGENCERKCRIKRLALSGWLSERIQVWKTPYPYNNAIIVAERIRDAEIRNSIGEAEQQRALLGSVCQGCSQGSQQCRAKHA